MCRCAVFAVLVVAFSSLQAQDRAGLEDQILSWSQEKLEQHEQFKRVGPAAEWRKKIGERDHEWLAVSLAVSYSIEKRVNEGLKGDRANTPVLDSNITRLRERLVGLGQYVVLLNR